PGATYRIGYEIKTVDVEGVACVLVDLFDSLGGSLFHVITEMPSGQYLNGTNDWLSDMFEVKVPARATYADLRLFISDKGKVFIRNVMMHRV
ncbi:MAG: hypothetical protein DRG69_02720, partial [Deltaproteobacteria bacterium]